MLESLLFIFLILVGGIFLIFSLIFLLIGITQESPRHKKYALRIGMIPILCFGLIAFWYLIAIPSFNNNQMEEFSGTYVTQNTLKELLTSKNETQLTLLSDGTYVFKGNESLKIKKSGTWKTGGIDGMFMFYDQDGSLCQWGSPSCNGNQSALKFEYKLHKDDIKWTQILLVKK